MGSLTSRPKVPQAQQPVYVTLPTPVPAARPAASPAASQSPAAAPVISDATGSETSSDTGNGTSGAEAARLAREDNLLRRGRGRLGTVLTGLSGVLSQAAAPLRKTLLGE